MIEQNMAENENVIIEESKNLETEKNYSAELSDKLDKILLSLTELTKSITELNSKEVKLEEEVKEVEEVKVEETKEESEELSQLRKEVQELKANSKVALSEPKVAELAKPRSSLLGTPLTPAENKLKEVLLKNVNQTN